MIKSELSGSLKSLRDSVKKISLIVPSGVEQIRKVSSNILDALASYDIDDDGLFDIKLCVEEAVRNAIVHGNKSNRKLSVRTVYWVDGEALNIEIEDEGAGFNYKALRDPTKEENLLRNSGRGVYLIERLMDKVEFNDKGNKVKMTKFLGPKKI